MLDGRDRGVLAPLSGHQYDNLTTFRKNGQAVSLPIWFAVDGDRIYLRTAASSGKIKRIRVDPRVQIAPSTRDGQPLGPAVEARARILSPAESDPAARALYGKYGWRPRVFDLMLKLRRWELTYLELLPV